MKQIVKYFNLSVQERILKLKNKTNNFFKKKPKVNNFNKILISSIFFLFLYLFYLSLPTLYDKTWVQNNLESKLAKNFNIDFSVSADITYNILPSPHFLIRDTNIFIDNKGKNKKLSEIKKLKVFIGQSSFLDKEKIKIKKVLIDDANFSVHGEDIVFLNKMIYKKFSNKKINIQNGNIFFKDNDDEIITITKINSGLFFYDELKKLNLFNINGKIFNIPFDFNLKKNILPSGIKEINFKAKNLNFNINDKLKKLNNEVIDGKNIFSFLNTNIYTKYNIKDNLISFKSDESKINNSSPYYEGKLSLEPFELTLDLKIQRYDLFKLFNFDTALGELFKSKILFNENLSTNISVDIVSNLNNEIFTSSKVKFNIVNGRINFDKTKLINKKIGSVEISNSNLFFQNDNLILNSDLIIDIQKSEKLFSFFQTSKKLRKPIKNIFVNFDYDLLKKQLTINSLKIDQNISNDKMLEIIEEIRNTEKYNLNKAKRVFNKLFSAYVG